MKFLVVPFLFFAQFLIAQIKFTQTEFDLGKISKVNQDVVDVYIQNTTSSAIQIEGIAPDPGITFTKTANFFPPSQPQILRFKINPDNIGRFEKEVTIYLSNLAPITLLFKGNLKSLPANNLTDCPDFGSSGKYNTRTKSFTQPRQAFVEIQTTEEPLLAAIEPSIEEEEVLVAEMPNKEQGDLLEERSEQKAKKTPEERRNSPSLLTTLFGTENQTNEEKNAEPNPAEEKLKVEQVADLEAETVVNESLLNDLYKPNNVVFLIDASTSMKQEERMDLLKTSMIELLKPLRSTDFLSIVTYSGDAKVLLAPTSAIEKEVIIKVIENIVADGSTQAVKGIKKAIQIGKSNYLTEGNNQIILATDGAFDIGKRNESLRRKIAQTADDGLTITVLGIKNDNWTNKSLKEIAGLGRGELIKVNSYRDSSKLLSEIKEKSLR